MTSALEEACPAAAANTAPQDFNFEMECAITCFQRGGLSRHALAAITCSREAQTALFCVGKLGNPDISAAYKAVLYILIQQPPVFRRFADLLVPEIEMMGKGAAPRPGTQGRAICFPVTQRQKAADRCLSALRRDEGFTFPLLFEMLQTGEEDIQVRISRLAQKLRLDFACSAYLLLHSPARIRVSTLESMVYQQGKEAVTYFRLCICDPEPQVRAVAALGLCMSGDSLGMKSLMEMAAHPDCEIRACAVAVLLRLDQCALLSMLHSVPWAKETAPGWKAKIM
jgi:hypothetical protein